MSPVKHLFNFMRRPAVLIISIILIMLCYTYVDRPLAEYLASLNLRNTMHFLNWVTKLGTGIVYMFSFFCLALLFRFIHINKRLEESFWFLWLCILITGASCGVLKVLLGRARPSLWFKEQAYGFYGLQSKAPFWSFPSGHTTTIMAVAFGLSVVFPRYCYAWVIAGFSVAVSRILLTHHYLTDVIAAAYLTLLEIGVFLLILEKKGWLKGAWQDKTYGDKIQGVQCL